MCLPILKDVLIVIVPSKNTIKITAVHAVFLLRGKKMNNSPLFPVETSYLSIYLSDLLAIYYIILYYKGGVLFDS